MARRQLARQQGVAVITALLLTTLAVTIVASLFWQQQVQVRSMENQRLHLQTKWILRGALELSSLILKSRTGQAAQITTLDQVWTTPLAETRLDQYIERERVQNEVFDATLSGGMSDATARYNLTLLAANGVRDPDQEAIFKRLLSNLQLDPALAVKIAQMVASANPAAPVPPARVASNVPMGLVQVDDLLAISGITKDTVDRLREFVIVLPATAQVNLNTASAEVLSALLQNCSVSQARAIVEKRKQVPALSPANFTVLNQGMTFMANAPVDVKSSYFLARSRIRLDRAALDAESLIESNLGSQTTVLWTRQN
ncbi:type II secretion system minor pseudopilin GspK [Massilia sp. DWR3-1-1]|uniref:type II secretion system minor pseudopilin GspK n=1 Tax=Massilia sp. DWR3-1-1 TaxID=2804559 RepID=UPI003CF75498